MPQFARHWGIALTAGEDFTTGTSKHATVSDFAGICPSHPPSALRRRVGQFIDHSRAVAHVRFVARLDQRVVAIDFGPMFSVIAG